MATLFKCEQNKTDVATGLWVLSIKELGVKDLKALLEHILFLVHRAHTNDFLDSTHIKYDPSIRVLAEETGFSAFSAANRGTSVLYYGAQKMRLRAPQTSAFKGTRKPGFSGKLPFYAWNGEQGCPRSEDECTFGHICSKCTWKGAQASSLQGVTAGP